MSGQCKARVSIPGDSFARVRPCKFAAVRDGYCARHHPDAVAEARAKKRARWDKEWEEKRRAAQLRDAAPMMLEACEAALAAFDGAPMNFSRDNVRAIALLREAIKKARHERG